MTIACVVLPTSAFSQDAPDEPPPTALEQTLAEHVCDRLPPSTSNQDLRSPQEVREQCAGVQLRALRAEFGSNLGHLSAAERARIDSTCSRLRKPENYEPYLNCLTALLVAIREQRRGADGMAPVAPGDVTFGVPAVPANVDAPPPPKRHWVLIVITLLGVVVAAAAGVGTMHVKKRAAAAAPARVCQRCGEALQSTGDLCSACRHEAGLAAKQAIADRAAEEREELDRRRLEREQADERQRQLEQQAAERQRLEEARLQAERDRQQAEAQMPMPQLPMTPVPVPIPVVAAIEADVDDTPEELDPYAVLGVSRGASRQQIDSAYCAAASKYDETQVAHLGDAVQAHYRSKAEAIEHAYRTLIAG
jgi:DnaJ-domain-containing protein 1